MQPKVIQGFRLSPQQRRLWSLLQADAAAFSACCAILIEGELAPQVLKQAVRMVAGRHEILRTLFRRLPGVTMPVQMVAEASEPVWQIVDLSELDAAQQEAAIEERRRREEHSSFDFENGPLMHVTLLALAPGRNILLISLPAISADFCTLNNLFTELGSCYAACAEGGQLPDAPMTYAQFSDWQNELLEDEEAAAGLDYWRRQSLAEVATVTLPFANRIERAARFKPQSLTMEIEPQVAAQLAAVAASYQTTPDRLLLACWQTLLWRRAEQPEIIVGQQFDGREYEMLQGTFGLLSKWLPVRCRFSESQRLSEVLFQINEAARDANDWQDYFTWETEESAAVAGQSAFFPFGFEFQQLPAKLSAAGLSFSIHRQHSYTERFHVKLSCLHAQEEERLTVEFHYDSALFDTASINCLARQFETFLQSALNNTERAIGEIEVSSDAERQQLLVQWNETAIDYPRDKCVHELFEAQVERTPTAVAVVFENERLTYAELNERANQLAHRLRRMGVGPEVLVGIMMERSIEMMVAVLGILKAGGAYLPLDPQYPAGRLAFMIEDAGVGVLLSGERLRAFAPETTKARIIYLDAERAAILQESAENPAPRALPGNLAYVIYTSGSTGMPKGVMIQHASAVNLATALQRAVYAEQASALRVSVNASLAFDSSVKQILQLLFGHALYLVPEEVRLNATALLAYIEQHALDVFDCTPSQLRILEAAVLMGKQNYAPTVTLIGGEALDQAAWSLLGENGKTRYYNVYGPTECTVDATICGIWTTPLRPTIGRPLANTQIYLLDKQLKPVPITAAGELHIGGNGLARGYLHRPELTAEKFIPNPFSREAGARLYKTGDLARYLPDGQIEFLGRIDTQVKIRGFRIELGEIEALLARHEKVGEAIVLAREDGAAGNKRLVAYVVSRRETPPPTPAELREHLAATLPEYMMPTAFVILEEFPLTRNGKVDRSGLPAPESVVHELPAMYIAPGTEVEQAIVNIWQEVLQVNKIGIHDNFFDLGGHSLLVVQVHGKLREAFDTELSIVEMFRNPTVSALARYFGDGQGQLPSFGQVQSRAEKRKQAVNRRTQSRMERKNER
jgi:amino acid adenylation domain-containing protein